MSSLTCPHCQAVLRSTNPIPAGKAIKCPKCAQVFRAGGSAVRSNPALTASRPTAAPPAPARKFGLAWKLAIVGIGFFFLLLVGGGAVLALVVWPAVQDKLANPPVAQTTTPASSSSETGKPQPPAAPPVDPLAYLPADSSFWMGVDMQQVHQVSALKGAMDDGLKSPQAGKVVQDLTAATGLTMDDLLGRITVAIKLPPSDVIGATPKGTMVIQTRAPFDPKKVGQSSIIASAHQAGTKTYYRLKKEVTGDDRSLLFMPSDRVIVTGDVTVDEFQVLLQSEGKRISLDAEVEKTIRRLSTGPAWGLVPVDASVRNTLAQMTAELPTRTSQAVTSARLIALWSELDSQQLKLFIGLQCTDTRAAADAVAGLQPFWTKMKGVLTKELQPVLAQLPPEVKTLVDQLIRSVRLETKETWAQASAAVSLQPLEALVQHFRKNGPGAFANMEEIINPGGCPPAAVNPGKLDVIVPSRPPAAQEQDLLAAINKFRQDSKRPALRLDPVLANISREQAEIMAKLGRLDDNTFNQRLQESTYRLSAGQTLRLHFNVPNVPADQVLKDLVRIGRQDLLNKQFVDCGIGIAQTGTGESYFFLLLAAPAK